MALVPTKGNLILAQNTLTLSKTGFELLDKKRNILIREMMQLIESAKEIQDNIENTFKEAYSALQTANLEMGVDIVENMSLSVDIEDSLKVKFRSVMGVEIPIVIMEDTMRVPTYGFHDSSSALDEAIVKFEEVKKMMKLLSEVENSVFRLADNIKKTQKRANALKNILIPRYEAETKTITDALEEKEREEFSRLKVIKNLK